MERWLLEEVPLCFTFGILKMCNTQQNPMEIATLLPLVLTHMIRVQQYGGIACTHVMHQRDNAWIHNYNYY